MEIFGNRMPSKEIVLRVLGNLFLPEKDKKPLTGVFYINDTCNARCEFCSQKEHIEDAGGAEQTDLPTQKQILASIRKDTPNIYLMGGEPSIHPYLEELLTECEALDFDIIGINTNAIIYRPEILEYANMLVLSLFSAEPLTVGSKLLPDSNADQQTKLGERVIENIKKYAKERDPEETVIVINKVVTGEEGDIKGVFEIIQFCKEFGIKLNIAPAIMPDNHPDPKLINNRAWEFLIDFLLRNMDLVVCSVKYLKTIRRFDDFYCTPNVVPAIRHNGDIDVPCPNVPSPVVVNLLQTSGVAEALKKGREEFGDFDTGKCKDQCHKTCYVETSNLSGEAFALEAMKKLFRKRVNGTLEGQSYSYVDLLLDFCTEDMHDYDSAIGDFLKPVREKDNFFTELIKELSDDELTEMEDVLSSIWNYFDDIWKITAGGGKAARLAADVVNQIFTRPFTSIFQKIQKVLGTSLIADYSGVRAMNRIIRYKRIIGAELTKRTQKIAA